MKNSTICTGTASFVGTAHDACDEDTMSLNYFIDRLAEDLVLGEITGLCGMCVIGSCNSQVSGITCRNGVKTWLLNKVEEYAGDMPVREEQYFAFLDRIRLSGCEIPQARQQLEQAFPHLKRSVAGADAIICAWQRRRLQAKG